MARILIIDDDKDLLNLVESFLLKEGFEVQAFSNWETAWDEIKNYKPQLILLDIFLTGIDGLDVCGKLKSTHFTHNIPVIVFSSFPNIAETAINEFGADDFIAKPFEVGEVIRKINNTLARTNLSA
ncbi:MAG: response regulator [Ginsengibacter sp.]